MLPPVSSPCLRWEVVRCYVALGKGTTTAVRHTAASLLVPWESILEHRANLVSLTRDIEFCPDCVESKRNQIANLCKRTKSRTHNKKPTMSDQTREKATLFVGGLDSQVTAQTLHDAFIPFGEIADISLPKPEL